ncbi:dipeptide ABC transporter ATP-binding protein [Pseudorhodobacter turbinis]|uniref:Dipeptide ABC transporter ATP-binding protein n=1 Tax=Pseudorhodobacter turbinis TaxID=2500533 RepID=A0A4P8EDD9_9RHOB|nr:dipeptide ABC transporter ATP-binding protein [Pseudorhodobacter turbinis]QCO54365.1 dipeptide ABC transporter ATP-binding protein [Pseudorhodobacter turbinis]
MTNPVLQVENLSKHFPVRRGALRRLVGNIQAVSNISFTVNRAETLAIVGESGCGKSTLGRTIMRLMEPTAGRVLLDGQDVTAMSKTELREARRRMQIIFQDPYGSLNPRMTVRETLAEPLLLHGLATPETLDRQVDEVLSLSGLSSYHAERYPHEFSGGQRQRVGIARALATRPGIIVCDEPVSALDVSLQAQIVNLLQDLKHEFGLAYVFISHDLSVVRHIADRVAVMYLGRFVEEASAETLFSRPLHPYTRSLIKAVPLPDPSLRGEKLGLRGDMPSALSPPSGCAFHVRCPMATDICRVDRPEQRQIGETRVACHHADNQLHERDAAPVERAKLAERLAVLQRAHTATTTASKVRI